MFGHDLTVNIGFGAVVCAYTRTVVLGFLCLQFCIAGFFDSQTSAKSF